MSNKPKDPKKVAAGKARAAKALRNESGQLQSNSFKEEVQKFADASGLHTSSVDKLQKFYEQNPRVIEDYLSQETRSQNRYSIKTIEGVLDRTTKKTFLEIEGERTVATPDQIAYEMARLEQYCYTHRDITGVVWKKSRTGTSDPIVKLPDISNEELDEMDDQDFVEYLAEFGIMVFISDLRKVKDKSKRKQRETYKENKLKYAQKVIRETRPKRRKRKS